MRKHAFWHMQKELKRAADERLCFHCTARFVSDLVSDPEDRFSHDTAQFKTF